MKKWFVVLAVLVLGVVAFVGAPAMAGNDIESSQWALTYCWDGLPCGNATWFITYPTFSDDQGTGGSVALSFRPLSVCMNYSSGCFPAYCTQQIDRNAGTASGEMTGEGCHGTWSASRICQNCSAPALNPGRGVSGN